MNRTSLLTDYRWEETPTTDRFRTELLYTDPTLLSMGLKGLTRALGFASTVSTENYIRRAQTRGHLAGEIGSLTTPCAWLQSLLTPNPAPQPAPQAPAPRPTYPADVRYNERRREERNGSQAPGNRRNGHTTDYATATPSVLAESTPHTGARHPDSESESATDSYIDSDSVLNPDSDAVLNPGGVGGDTAALVAALVTVGMEPEDAERRLAEFGPDRCRDALDALACERERGLDVHTPVGFVLSILRGKATLPYGLEGWRKKKQREREQAERQAQEREARLQEANAAVQRFQESQARRREREEGNGHGDLGTLAPGPA